MVDLVLILALVALGAWWHTRAPQAPTPAAVPGDSGFTLEDVDGNRHTYDGRGSLFIVLTAVGCGDCVNRIEADRAAVEEARKHGVPAWNLLVFADRAAGKQFLRSHNPTADRVLVDPDSAVSVKKYRGSDAAAWILVRDGKVAWQGAADLPALRAAF